MISKGLSNTDWLEFCGSPSGLIFDFSSKVLYQVEPSKMKIISQHNFRLLTQPSSQDGEDCSYLWVNVR